MGKNACILAISHPRYNEIDQGWEIMGVDVETEKEHRFFTSVFHTGYGPKIYTQDQYSRHKDWDGEKAYELVEAISRATVKLFASL